MCMIYFKFTQSYPVVVNSQVLLVMRPIFTTINLPKPANFPPPTSKSGSLS